MTTSLVAEASISRLNPSPVARVSIVGFLKTWPVSHTITGTSPTPSAHEVPARGQHVDLAREFPGTEHRDPLFTPVDGADDFDGALDDHEEAGVLLAELEQHLARADLAALADAGDPIDLSLRQLGEHLVATFGVHLCHVITRRLQPAQPARSRYTHGKSCPP